MAVQAGVTDYNHALLLGEGALAHLWLQRVNSRAICWSRTAQNGRFEDTTVINSSIH